MSTFPNDRIFFVAQESSFEITALGIEELAQSSVHFVVGRNHDPIFLLEKSHSSTKNTGVFASKIFATIVTFHSSLSSCSLIVFLEALRIRYQTLLFRKRSSSGPLENSLADGSCPNCSFTMLHLL